MIRGKNKMIAKVAVKVSWNHRENKLAGLNRSKKKALMDRALIKFTSFQKSFPKRKARAIIVARITEGRPSTRKA